MQRADSLEKSLMLGKIEGRRKRGQQDEMVGWHHWVNGHEFEQTLGNSEGQGSLACCSLWGCKKLDMTERLNNSLCNSWCMLANTDFPSCQIMTLYCLFKLLGGKSKWRGRLWVFQRKYKLLSAEHQLCSRHVTFTILSLEPHCEHRIEWEANFPSSFLDHLAGLTIKLT